MRSFIVASAVIGLVAAAPAPQDIDFDLAYALPNPVYTVASDATAQTVSYNPTTVYSAAIPQITASNTVSDLDTTTTDPATAAGNQKRAACATQPAGAGPVPSPDTPSAFAAYASFASIASAAPVPTGYTQTFTNLNGSNNAYGYMGFTTLNSYDPVACAAKCDKIYGCISVNIYFERDPTVDPGNGNSGCANPASTTNIKCVFWGGPVEASNANNMGQWRNQFQVLIAGSNGYVNSSIAQVPGYGTAVPLGNAAINAPYDQYGFNSFMGSTIFVGNFDAELCAQACTEKSNYAIAHPPTDGSPVQTCQFFNTYILYINSTDTAHTQGQYCAMYSESWSSKYATNVGQYRGNDHFIIGYSYAYSNASNAGSANPVAAVYQAKNDIQWPGNSAAPYCSSLLGYTQPVTTSVTSTTVTPTSYSDYTVYTSVTTDAPEKRVAASATPTTTPSSIAEPAVLTKYPASIVQSACSLAVTSPATSTVVSVTTVSASPVVVSSAVATSTVPAVREGAF